MRELVDGNGNIFGVPTVQVIGFDGKPKTVTSGTPIGPAGGDLSGSYPNPSVVWNNGLTTYNTQYYPLSSNPSGYITGITSIDITTALGYTPYNSTNPSGYISGITSLDVTTALGYTPVNKSGDSMLGFLTLNSDPTSALHAATKQYVDNLTAGINFHAPCHVATTGNLTATYSNGISGVGATLTATVSGALTIDSHIPVLGDRVLVWQQSTGLENGIYDVTDTGSVSTPWILTRSSDADNSPSGELQNGDFTFIQQGTTYGGYGFILNTTGTITVGVTTITYVQFNAAQIVAAGYGLQELTPNVLSVDTSLIATVASLGSYLTAATAAATYYPLTNPSGYTSNLGTVTSVGLTAGTGISLSGTNPIVSSGSITVTNSAPDQIVALTAGTGIGVAGTYPNFTISNTDPTSGVTLTSAGGTETLVNNGTGPSLATKGVSAGTGISLSSSATTLTVTNSAPDQVVALTAGTGIGITGTYPNFTITNSSPASASVTSVTGVSPISSSGGTTPAISIQDAAADGTTKGAAAFNANDFNAVSGVIAIDYTNGKAASTTDKGFLTSTDWNTFDGKQDALTAGYGITGIPTPAVSLTSAQAFITGTVSISTATYADITGASITLAAGTWLIMGNVYGYAGNTLSLLNAAITDGANVVQTEGAASAPLSGSAAANIWLNVALSVIVTPTVSTTYKLRAARGNTTITATITVADGSGQGVANNASTNSDKGTGIRAIRIA